LEATGVEDSGNPAAAKDALAAAYTDHHLQARPDLVSVVGILLGEFYFNLLFFNACRVYQTRAVGWSSPEACELLYTWMWRQYHPERDQSITFEMKTYPRPTFTVTTTDGRHYDRLVVLNAGESIGRRTMVLGRPDRDCDVVIKGQHISIGRQCTEGPTLEMLHLGGRFPGVVHPEHWEYVMNEGQKLPIECKETSLIPTVTWSKFDSY
jgi:hypothetical protein